MEQRWINCETVGLVGRQRYSVTDTNTLVGCRINHLMTSKLTNMPHYHLVFASQVCVCADL